MTSWISVIVLDQIGLVQYEFFLLLIINHLANVVGVDDIDMKTKGRQRKD